MLRVIHSQSRPGEIIIGDIEDGVRFGSRHLLDNAKRAVQKQKIYVHFTNPSDATQPGYVDLIESDKVMLSWSKGCIAGLVSAGLASVVHYAPADLATPAITVADLGTPGAGDLTVTGTKLLSLAPDVSSLVLTGTGAITLTRTQVLAGAGTWTEISIFVPAALIPGVALTTTSAKVVADRNNSNVLALT